MAPVVSADPMAITDPMATTVSHLNPHLACARGIITGICIGIILMKVIK